MAIENAPVSYKGVQYRLRAASPMPIPQSAGCGYTPAGNTAGYFILQTFGAESNVINIYDCSIDLPESREFRGQNGNLVSANFSRLGDRTGTYFSGRTVEAPTYIEEDDYNLIS
jgi:hypothetical protein